MKKAGFTLPEVLLATALSAAVLAAAVSTLRMVHDRTVGTGAVRHAGTAWPCLPDARINSALAQVPALLSGEGEASTIVLALGFPVADQVGTTDAAWETLSGLLSAGIPTPAVLASRLQQGAAGLPSTGGQGWTLVFLDARARPRLLAVASTEAAGNWTFTSLTLRAPPGLPSITIRFASGDGTIRTSLERIPRSDSALTAGWEVTLPGLPAPGATCFVAACP